MPLPQASPARLAPPENTPAGRVCARTYLFFADAQRVCRVMNDKLIYKRIEQQGFSGAGVFARFPKYFVHRAIIHIIVVIIIYTRFSNGLSIFPAAALSTCLLGRIRGCGCGPK